MAWVVQASGVVFAGSQDHMNEPVRHDSSETGVTAAPAAVGPATILVIDDMAENLAVIGEALRSTGFAVRVANSGATGLALAVREPPPDLILLDIMMPEIDGHEVLRRLQDCAATREIPVIFLTAMDDVRDVVAGLNHGAVDYITKPCAPEVVVARVRAQLAMARVRAWLSGQNAYLEEEVARRTADVQHYVAQLERRSNYDDLTDLPNHNLLKDRLAQAINRAGRATTLTAVMVLNIDRFKNINDSLGHDAGDEMLREAAQRLAGGVGDLDTLARGDGDEFVVVAEIDTAEAGEQLARRLLTLLTPPFQLGGRELRLTGSIGIAMYPKDGRSGDELLKCADSAMLKAKAAGGNRCHFYEAEMNRRSLERLEMETELRNAIELGQLVLHYQPQLNLHVGEIIGAEALVRWQHPTRGLVMPADFIPLAEDCGLIAPLGEWVMRAACGQNKAWQDAGLRPISVSVNLSAHQFLAQDVVALAASILKDTGLDPAYLELELTESAVMADAAAFIDATRNLKDLAVTLSIDDFGTGYSSLSYLRRFAIDRLKIDQSFVRELTYEPNSAAIALAIISLAHTLRLSAIAEGVETEGQLNFLRQHGCDEMQGFYFSRPVPAADLEQMLRDGTKMSPASESPQQRTLLLVDDEANILAALKRLFRREGYTVLTAEDGMAGLEVLARQRVDVVISDGRMPGMSGAEFLGKVRQLHPDTVRIVLSGYTDLNAVTNAVNRGELFRFLLKPWNDAELVDTVREAFRYSEAKRSQGGSAPLPSHGPE
jgi:diguanylate cyclase (GGDEF)-like protein